MKNAIGLWVFQNGKSSYSPGSYKFHCRLQPKKAMKICFEEKLHIFLAIYVDFPLAANLSEYPTTAFCKWTTMRRFNGSQNYANIIFSKIMDRVLDSVSLPGKEFYSMKNIYFRVSGILFASPAVLKLSRIK